MFRQNWTYKNVKENTNLGKTEIKNHCHRVFSPILVWCNHLTLSHANNSIPWKFRIPFLSLYVFYFYFIISLLFSLRFFNILIDSFKGPGPVLYPFINYYVIIIININKQYFYFQDISQQSFVSHTSSEFTTMLFFL